MNDGEWHLRQLAVDACKIEFCLRYEFRSAVMARLAGPVFGSIADALVDKITAEALQEEIAQKKAAALAGMANAARIANAAPLQPAPAKVE